MSGLPCVIIEMLSMLPTAAVCMENSLALKTLKKKKKHKKIEQTKKDMILKKIPYGCSAVTILVHLKQEDIL